jgi:hypothetical protein
LVQAATEFPLVFLDELTYLLTGQDVGLTDPMRPILPLRLLLLTAFVWLSLAASASAINWPMDPRTTSHALGNSYGEYQWYGGAPYLHPGIDVMGHGGQPVYAVKSGYVKAVLTTAADLHWRVAIGDLPGTAECDGWLYAHLDQPTIQVLPGDYVTEGEYLGDLVPWPVASFHHCHFVKIRNSGYPWVSDWAFVANPLDELTPITDTAPPVFRTVAGGAKFAFFPNNTHSYLPAGSTLSGAIDIIARVDDKVQDLFWCLTPYRITYEVRNDTFSTGPITSVVFTGRLFWQDNVNVIYQNDATYDTRGDYDARDYYFVVTNTDGDSVIEAGDASGAWHTENFNNGPWWVKVTAYDRGGNATVDSMQATTANYFTLTGSAVPCDGDPDSTGAAIRAPDLPGSPQTTAGTHGGFTLPGLTLGTVRLQVQRTGYATLDTNVTVPGSAPSFRLIPDYLVGDCNHDRFCDVFDIIQLIDVVFSGSTNLPVPYWSGDIDFNRLFDVFDVVALIDYVFSGAAAPRAPTCFP